MQHRRVLFRNVIQGCDDGMLKVIINIILQEILFQRSDLFSFHLAYSHLSHKYAFKCSAGLLHLIGLNEILQ